MMQAAGQTGAAPTYITPSGLRDKRYWTDSMIKSVLGKPDKLVQNPHRLGAAPMRLYLLSRVRAAEAGMDIGAMRKSREWRSAAGHRGAATRENNIIRRAAECDLGCRFDEPLDMVMLNAAGMGTVEYKDRKYEIYAGRSSGRGAEPHLGREPDDVVGTTAENRRAVSYLLHERTKHDRLLYELGGIAGFELRKRACVKISDMYPELREAAMEMV